MLGLGFKDARRGEGRGRWVRCINGNLGEDFSDGWVTTFSRGWREMVEWWRIVFGL